MAGALRPWTAAFAACPRGFALRAGGHPLSSLAGLSAARPAAAAARWPPPLPRQPTPYYPGTAYPSRLFPAAAPAPAAAAAAGAVRMLAAPRKALPKRTVRVHCAACRAFLYKYHKGGTGALVKVYLERIAVDATPEAGVCGGCGAVVARPAVIHGRPALKMVGGKVVVKK